MGIFVCFSFKIKFFMYFHAKFPIFLYLPFKAIFCIIMNNSNAKM